MHPLCGQHKANWRPSFETADSFGIKRPQCLPSHLAMELQWASQALLGRLFSGGFCNPGEIRASYLETNAKLASEALYPGKASFSIFVA